MTQNTWLVLFVTALLAFTPQAQQNQASAQASVTVSGGSISELQESLTSAAEASFAELGDNPDDLDTIVVNLANQLAQAIAQIMITFIEDGSGTPRQQSNQIASAVSVDL
eukprot:TRINITY_DN204625_c0_g1_i1.p3 TRINITY_DN204625_c0_g1~~TRINITY_DN204625_c0_g1_i1.p3  ORF type:complete len:110 (-),score=17.06 TRINITY_DN204625_c0_g1_i1:25-354(-)